MRYLGHDEEIAKHSPFINFSILGKRKQFSFGEEYLTQGKKLHASISCSLERKS